MQPSMAETAILRGRQPSSHASAARGDYIASPPRSVKRHRDDVLCIHQECVLIVLRSSSEGLCNAQVLRTTK
jgi:hypothetical protein